MKSALVFLLGLVAAVPSWPDVTTGTVHFRRFGDVTLYRSAAPPESVALFVSGDGGWNRGVVDMARSLAAMNALVVGIDLPRYLKNLEAAEETCSYPAADLEALSQFVQQREGLPAYHVPVLVGYSSGATLVYAVLVQAPPNTFAGAISMGFCPDLPLSRPFCRGSGLRWEPGPRGKGASFLPAAQLPAPWVVLEGDIDQVCGRAQAAAFVEQVPGARLVALPHVGHGFAVQRNWLPQFRDAFRDIVLQRRRAEEAEGAGDGPSAAATAAPTPGGAVAPPETPAAAPPAVPGVSDLPLVVVPARGTPRRVFAVILSGDGGWAGIDREIGGVLAADGVPVVGLDSLKYFWNKRTPDGAAADLVRIIRHFRARWQAEGVILVGYSFGADALPFLANRLPADLRAEVRLVALLSPSHGASFEFHVAEWLGARGAELPTLPEIGELRGEKILCVYGQEEKDTVCRDLRPPQATVLELTGAHHYGGAYDRIARAILAQADLAPPAPEPAPRR